VELADSAKRQKRDGLFELLEKREQATAAVEAIDKVITKVYRCPVVCRVIPQCFSSIHHYFCLLFAFARFVWVQCKTALEFQSQHCRDSGHAVTQHKVTKRFFECNGCHTKTMSVWLLFACFCGPLHVR
jgi:hypothetical protein